LLVFEKLPGYPMSHAATIYEVDRGSIMCCWYAGSYEGAEDVAIFSSFYDPENGMWREPRVLVDTPGQCDGNPVLFKDPRGVVWLFYVTMLGPGWRYCKINFIRSYDGGLSWRDRGVLRDELGWMVRNHPIVTSDGAIILPVYDEVLWNSMVMISEDWGENWSVSSRVSVPGGCIQPAVVELSKGVLLMYLRTRSGRIWRSLSNDGGMTWDPPEPVDLPNPNSNVELIKLKDGRLLLVYNDSPVGRTPLSVALSEPGSDNWVLKRNLECGEGEYSYPSAIESSSGMIHVVYTNRRENIKHVIFDVSWLTSY